MPISADRAAQVLADPALTCQGWAVEVEAQPSIIQFVVDISGSMNDVTDSTAGVSKWNVTRNALKDAIRVLPETWGIGIVFYPNMMVDPSDVVRSSSACVDSSNDVALSIATAEHKGALFAALDAVEPTGATPTYDAYSIALDERLNKTTLPGNRYIVLITDGQPTQGRGCVGSGAISDPQPPDDIIALVAHAQAQHLVQTFVVGSPGSEKNAFTGADVRGWLSQAARTGGTSPVGCSDAGPNFCHFDVSQSQDFSAALGLALTTITRSAVSCSFGVPLPAGNAELDPAKVNMIYNDGKGGYFLVLPGETNACDKGWSFVGSAYDTVEVCGSTCSLIQANPMSRLSIVFGCVDKGVSTLL